MCRRAAHAPANADIIRATATAVRRGMAAGALATTLPGASPSLPDQKAVDELLAVAEGAAR